MTELWSKVLNFKMIDRIFLLILIVPLMSQVDYDSQIQTIFDNSCIMCHGNAGGLDLTTYDNVMNGGSNGAVIIPGDHAGSELYIRITLPSSSDEDMPPQGEMSQGEIDLIAQWIDEGAVQETTDCNPDLACGGAFTCCDGLLYPSTCCDENCDEPIGECEDALLGDMNGDGIINVLDVVLMVSLVLAGGFEELADMNDDGIINILDIVNLINEILL